MAVIKMSSSSMSSDMDSDFDVGDVEEGATVGSIQVSMHDPQVFRSLMKSESDEIPSDVESESEQPLKDKEEIPEIQPETAKLNAEISRNNKPKVPQKASVNSQPRQKPKNIQKNIDFTQKMTRSLSHSSLDFENPQKSHRENIDIDERFYKYQEKVKEKVDKLAKDITQDQMKECTFQPAIKNDGQRRTVDEFVSEMQKYEKDKQNKLTAQREENLKTQNSVEQSYQPVICEKSLQILAKKGDPNTSVHEKLYKIDKSKPSKQVEKIKQEYSMIEKSSFKPLVNQKSHGLKRSDSIDKLLYDDALRRIHKEVEIPSLKKEKFISERSEQVLINKLTKEFAEIFDMLDIDNSGILNYINTLNLLQKLYMIKNDPENPKHEDEKALVLKMWRLLGGDESSNVAKENLETFVLGVMNYYLPKMSASIDNEHTSVTSSIGKLIEGTYNLQESEVPKLHRSFTSFYETRTAKTHKSNQNPRHKNAVEYSFKPHINESSVVLASGVKYKRSDSLGSYTKTEDYLLSDHIKIQEKLERKRKLQEKEDTKECTFKPKINEKPKFLTQKKENKDTLSEEYKKLSGELTHEHRSVALYSLSEAQRKRKSELLRKAEENEIEKTQSECTFTPKIEKKRVKDETDVLAKKGVTEAINRMKRAREEQALIRSLKERGFTNQGDLKPLNFSQESLQKSRSSITFSRPPLPAQNKPKEKRDSLKVLKDQENTQELASLQDCE